MHQALCLSLIQPPNCRADVLGNLGNPFLCDDPDSRCFAGPTEILNIRITDKRLLDQYAHLSLAGLHQKISPENRFVGHGSLWKRECPFAQPVIRTRAADGGNSESILDGFASRYTVVRYVRTENHETAFLDQFAVRIDDGFDRAFWQTLHLSIHDLHRTIDHPCLKSLSENEFEGKNQVLASFVRETVGQREIEEVAQLDRLSRAFVRHGFSCPPYRNELGTRDSRR